MSSRKEPPQDGNKERPGETNTRNDATIDNNGDGGGREEIPTPPLSALQRAAAADKLLIDCIAARADLGVLTSRRIKERGQTGDDCGTDSAMNGGK